MADLIGAQSKQSDPSMRWRWREAVCVPTTLATTTRRRGSPKLLTGRPRESSLLLRTSTIRFALASMNTIPSGHRQRALLDAAETSRPTGHNKTPSQGGHSRRAMHQPAHRRINTLITISARVPPEPRWNPGGADCGQIVGEA